MIYLLEDESSIRELVIYALNSAGFHAEGFDTPSAFWSALSRQTPELVLLDIMLPEEDGLSVLKKLRAARETALTPVIMLTARGSEYDKVLGLELGADDYLPKPFGMMELLARVKALLRRAGQRGRPEEYRIGGLRVCPETRLVQADGQDIALTLKEFELLCMLLRAGGRVLTRDQLLEEIWGYAFDGESRTVDVHIRTLRQKLGPAGDCIETVRGVGYKIGGSRA